MVSEMDRSDYNHTLPANPRRLQSKRNDYLQSSYYSLIHKNFCNKEAAKINDEYKEGLLIELMAHNNNLDNARIAEIYNHDAKKLGWKLITPAAVQVWREKMILELEAGRRGSRSFYDKNTMHFKRRRPTAPLYFWTIDGWDTELM